MPDPRLLHDRLDRLQNLPPEYADGLSSHLPMALHPLWDLGADGAPLDLGFERPQESSAQEFDGDAVRGAILGAQQGRVMYPEFKKLSQRAGCIGYTVWIAGRHVTYFGRCGETHIERFPNSA